MKPTKTVKKSAWDQVDMLIGNNFALSMTFLFHSDAAANPYDLVEIFVSKIVLLAAI